LNNKKISTHQILPKFKRTKMAQKVNKEIEGLVENERRKFISASEMSTAIAT